MVDAVRLLDLGAAGVFLACTAQTVRKAEELQRVGQKNFLLECAKPPKRSWFFCTH